ncbi:MAG: hypothetical protein HY302_06245 [Opitutae bacterium]|nr:hypothetical protein [Opitutae bacterium]
MRLLKTLSASLLLFLLAACASTPQARIEKNRAAFDGFPADVQEKIRAGKVELGFTPVMVRLALGGPDREVNRASATGQEEVWIYRRARSGVGFGFGLGAGGGHTGYGAGVAVNTAPGYDEEAMRVVFRDGKVSAVETRVK